MSGTHFTTVSPSSSISRRSTPWVDGCCGPMLRTMRRCPVAVWTVSRSAATSGGIAVSLILNSIPGDGIILAQRMPFPIVGHHDAPQIGVIDEADAEEIENFALVPIRPAPHRCDRFDNRVGAAEPALQTD